MTFLKRKIQSKSQFPATYSFYSLCCSPKWVNQMHESHFNDLLKNCKSKNMTLAAKKSVVYGPSSV